MRYDALVVGAGPNGLAAAIVLARAGHSVKVLEAQPTWGGGCRSLPLTGDASVHDLCSAIHPLAVASPFFSSLGLERHGLRFIHPPAPVAHPLDGGQAVLLERSLSATAEGLGADGPAWTRLFGPLVEGWETVKELLLKPVVPPPLPGRPFLAASFGLTALRSAFWLAEETFEGPRAKALFAGCAAHSFSPLTTPLTSAVGCALVLAGHAVGWPLVEGGSQRLADALVAELRAHGGEVETGVPVNTLHQLEEARLVLFDTHARVMARICGPALPGWYHALLEGFQPGPGVFKVDYLLDAPVPWAAPECRRAATLHLGGTLKELAESEAGPSAGRAPERPYVLVAQQSLFDATRAPGGGHTLWAYCHVPNGSTLDMTERIEAQLERFAPGFGRHVVKRVAHGPAAMERHNGSYLGGDISQGAMEGLQVFLRPTPGLPYRTPNPRVLLCSSSAPPGPGVHGMCGYWAAQEALRRLRPRG